MKQFKTTNSFGRSPIISGWKENEISASVT